jgi:hypothetical protein
MQPLQITNDVPKLDILRCERAMRKIYVRGLVGTAKGADSRQKAVEDAIAAIQRDPENALTKEYIGVKNYAGFGDQREDHAYNMGPRHGSIVFEIGRTSQFRSGALDEDCIYLLEACRDFPGIKENKSDPFADKGWRSEQATLDLCEVLKRVRIMQETATDYLARL